jgi:hypothetical protein
VSVEVAAGLVRLVNDSGSGSAAAGADGRVSNGQCEVTAGPGGEEPGAGGGGAAGWRRDRALPGEKQLYTIAQGGNGESDGLAPGGRVEGAVDGAALGGNLSNT